MSRGLQRSDEHLPIGLVVDWAGSYGRGVLHGIMAFANTHPRWVVRAANWGGLHPEGIEHWEVRGLIAQVFERDSESKLLAMGIPVVNVSNFLFRQRIPTVVPDDTAIARVGVEYLLHRGFRHLAFYGPTDCEFSENRRNVFRDLVKAAGCDFHTADSNAVLARWLHELPRPVAIMACNDNFAHRILRACRESSIRVPDDVAVLGVDDDELFNAMTTPSLSSVAIPADRVGYEAAALLDHLLSSPDAPALPPLPAIGPLGVVTRDSTDMVAVGNQDLAAALSYIRDHAGEPIQVNDVVDSVPLSRRSLERLFRERLNSSVLAEILRAHVERAKRVLVSTDTPLRNVARLSGFAGATRLGIVFAEYVGMPPSEYRRRYRVASRTARADVAWSPSDSRLSHAGKVRKG